MAALVCCGDEAGQRVEITMPILKLPCRKSDPVASKR